MPINASVEYQIAEENYRGAKTLQEKIAAMEQMLKTAPKHKGAENLLLNLKKRLAKLKEDQERKASKGRPSAKIKKEGSAMISLLGITNTGKSLLLAKLTNAKVKISEVEYTTTEPEQGIMDYYGIKIQIVELPSVYEGWTYKNGELVSILRSSDLILILVAGEENEIRNQLKLIGDELNNSGIKINSTPPQIKISKTGHGGLVFYGLKYFEGDKQITDKEKIAAKILNENNILNATISFHAPCSSKDLEDAVNLKVLYKPALIVHNKIDCQKSLHFVDIAISSLTEVNIEELKQKVWDKLNLIKVYTKSPSKEKDYPPIAMKKYSNIKELAASIHKDFVKKFRFARIWGNSAAFPGQRVGLYHRLEDDDVVELHI